MPVVIDPDGRVLHHSARHEVVGAAWSGPEELDAPIAAGGRWSGIVEHEGVATLAAIAQSRSTEARYLTLTELDAVDEPYRDAALSWWIVLGLIALVGVPLPLFLLHQSSRKALQAEEDARLRSESDVTRLYAVERELQALLRRLDAHVDNSPLALIEWDREHRIVRWSGGAERLFGWTSDEMLGRDVLQVAVARDPDSEGKLRTLIADGADRWVVQGCVRARDGRALHCSWHNSVLRDEAGGIDTTLALVQDVTLQHQAAVLQATQERIFERVLQGAPLSDNLHEFLRAFEQILPDSRSAVLLVDPDGQRLRAVATQGFEPGFAEAIDGLPIGPEGEACGAAAHGRTRVVCADVLADRGWDGLDELVRRHDLRACWSQPIVATGDVVLGAFAVYFRTRRAPTAAELAALDSAGSLAGLALERHLLRQLEETQRETLRMILDERSIETILDALVRGIERQIPGMLGAVLLRDPDGLRLRPAASPAFAPEIRAALDGLAIAEGSGTCGHACFSRELTISEDFATDPRMRSLRPLLERHGLRSGWSNPILSGENEVLGTFAMYWRTQRRPGERELALLETASRVAALAIERRMEEELKSTHQRVLKMILDGAPLEDSLGALVLGIQAQMLGMRGAVLRFDEPQGTLRVVAAPSLSRDYFRAFDGAPYPREARRTAARAIEVHAVRDDPLVSAQAGVFEVEAIRSVWSSPVSSAGGEVLGTFCCYWRDARPLGKRDQGLLELATNLAGLAIEHALAADERQQLTERLATLHEVGRAILGSDSTAGIAKAATERVLLQLRCARATVTLFDDRTSEDVLIAVASRKPTSVTPGSRPLTESLSRRYIEGLQRGMLVEIQDLRALQNPPPKVRALLREELQSAVLTPLVLQGTLLGTLNVGFDGPLRITDAERGFLSDVADMLALALEQGRLHEQARTLLARLGTLNEIGRRILEIDSPQGIALAALERIQHTIDCEHASVAVFDDAQRELEVIAAGAGLPGSVPVGTRVPFDALDARTVEHLRAGQQWIVADLAATGGGADPLIGEGPRSSTATPLLLQSQLIGVLTVGRSEAGAPAPDALELLRDVADLLAVGLTQMRLHEKIRQDAEQLERRVVERTAEVTAINEELESYVRTVSHDLRAPLRAIQGLGTAVIEDCCDRLDLQGLDYLGRMVSAAERMDRLLLDLLAYSRMGKVELGVQRLDASEVVDEARNLVHSVLQTHSAHVEVDHPLLPLCAHGPTLVQALTNLLTNAAKFTARGVRPRIRIGTEQRGRYVRLWVEDNGIGIPAEHHERIFRAFERLHGHAEYPGTGIGLAIVRRAAERMGGHAGVDSRPGEGSRFWIELPAAT
jgi:PAS domain S-box-containing protein